MMNIFSFGRLPELSFWQRLIHVFVTFGFVLVIADLLLMEQTDLWLAQLVIAIFGAVVGSVVFAFLEHAFFKMSSKRKQDEINDHQD